MQVDSWLLLPAQVRERDLQCENQIDAAVSRGPSDSMSRLCFRSLSSLFSSPHPVKPLTTAMLAEEKRTEGRSVLATGLEKLKSTIHPGRSSQLSEQETDRKKVQYACITIMSIALQCNIYAYLRVSNHELCLDLYDG